MNFYRVLCYVIHLTWLKQDHISLTCRMASPNHPQVWNYNCTKCQHSLFLFMTILIIISLGTQVSYNFWTTLRTSSVFMIMDREELCTTWNWCFLMFWGCSHMTITIYFLFNPHKSFIWHFKDPWSGLGLPASHASQLPSIHCAGQTQS